MNNLKKIPAAEFKALRDKKGDLHVIDVRTGAEYTACHVKGAKHYPLQDLAPGEVLQGVGGNDEPIYVLCKAGGRAQKAAEALAPTTTRDIVVVEGGTDACVACGVDVNAREGGVISLERQVRIAAGALVLTGVLLGWFVAPGFFALSGFVGAGLMFAGITDTCAMGMMLARMPWNNA
ncbi:rhodanese-like domain-containing protein [Kordiimonas gwangyangensis]|uniref:rhodanese-like domain-containing protein n=1 Tax=Kordiimonas gwangyangensis TaxID=288022 RepID=UPI00036100A8|nr:rhodanese-like domain-containing protein [Kordiimonas gwangyangensis]